MPSQVSRRSPLSSSQSQPSSVVSSTSTTPATSRNLSTMTGIKPPPPPPSNKAAADDHDELFSNDEVTVYKDEGESDEQQASENLTEIKLGLVTETEEASSPSIDVDRRSYSEDDTSSCTGPKHASDYILPLGCPSLVTSPFIGKDHKLPAANVIQKTIFGDVRKSSLGLYMCGTCPDGLAHPPPAHMGIPPLHIDPKTGLPSYSLQSAAAASSLLYGSDLTSLHFDLLARTTPYTPSHLQAWFTSPPSPTAAPGILSSHPGISYHSSVGFGLPSDLSLFSVDNIDGSSNRNLWASGENGVELLTAKRFRDRTNGSHGGSANGTGNDVMTADLSCLSTAGSRQRKPYIKKPLNAFMLFMKEMRQKVIDECTLKESAAINQILGRKWHALDRAEQARYYEMARKEKELHMQLYPGWSARDNYATRTKKKKLKRTTSSINGGDFGYVRSSSSSQFCTSSAGIDCTVSSTACQNGRKCRIHYGLDQQSRWCHICRVDYDSASENRPSSSRSETVQVIDDDLCMSSSGHGLHCRPVN